MLWIGDVGRASFEHFSCRPQKQCAASSLVADGIVARKSFFYSQMHQEPLNLTIMKLDGSSFRINARNGATVGELKRAVEDYFLPRLGPGKVSWPHVWGQFCFSYAGQKLLVEKNTLRDFGIKDGDVLHFVRHKSSGPKQRSPKKGSVSRHLEPNFDRTRDKVAAGYSYSKQTWLCRRREKEAPSSIFSGTELCRKLRKILSLNPFSVR